MVEESARNFGLTVYNFSFIGYICLYEHNKWLDKLHFNSVSLDQLYRYLTLKTLYSNYTKLKKANHEKKVFPK